MKEEEETSYQVVEYGTVEPKLATLAEAMLSHDESMMVEKLLQVLQDDSSSMDLETLIMDIHEITEREINNIPTVSMADDPRQQYRSQITDWMLDVRETTGTR